MQDARHEHRCLGLGHALRVLGLVLQEQDQDYFVHHYYRDPRVWVNSVFVNRLVGFAGPSKAYFFYHYQNVVFLHFDSSNDIFGLGYVTQKFTFISAINDTATLVITGWELKCFENNCLWLFKWMYIPGLKSLHCIWTYLLALIYACRSGMHNCILLSGR